MPKDKAEKIYRVFTEKKEGFDVRARALKAEIATLLKIRAQDVREFLRYDVQNISPGDFAAALDTVFSEPQADTLYCDKLPELAGYSVFAVEYLPGQYDQRADSCMQCVQLLTMKERPLVRCARVIAVKGVSRTELDAVKRYLINPVEAREADLAVPHSLETKTAPPRPTPVIEGFTGMEGAELEGYYSAMGFAMSLKDLEFVQEYFRGERRDPTLTELKVLDTYWSDHCRHTTFNTELTDIEIEEGNPHVSEAYKTYAALRAELYKDRPDKYPCLMDMATIAMRKLKKDGLLTGLDESEEINACSVKVKAKTARGSEDWLVMFKNETHNHPTEIEPFGGAATCLGGAIRDPLSGRAYVYQAMRITGAADPTAPLSETMKGKLPQRIITRTAAAGFSSYGNQIGLCTGIVKELYHPGYAAKRLETGFVIGGAPAGNVVRERPVPGDVVILLGGDTGRDGCGGATGSSKPHSLESLDVCGAEVQKGNPLTERNIQRLFRDPRATRLIKRCNDFGAGGVCVAIGELADGIDIDLSAVPLKYEGLTATETAISESQERMAVVVAKADAAEFIRLSQEQNLKAAEVAVVTGKNRMTMSWGGRIVLDLKREMLNSAGVRQYASARIAAMPHGYFDRIDPETQKALTAGGINAALRVGLSNLNVCSQKGLIEMFDSSIGASSVFAPLGGRSQLTPAHAMAALLPVSGGTETATVCAYGCDPELMSENAFLGAVYSVLTSIIKTVICGVDPGSVYLTLQEYFKRLKDDPARWGQPAAALLGAMYAQIKTGTAAIGGKDSMSGTFENLDVPPTLISFAVGVADAPGLITNVFERPGQKAYLLPLRRDAHMMPDFEYARKLLKHVYGEIRRGNVKMAAVTEAGGVACAAVKSCFGNGLGFDFNAETIGGAERLFKNRLGDIIVAVEDISAFSGFDTEFLGVTRESRDDDNGLAEAFTGTLERVFRTKTAPAGDTIAAGTALVTSGARPKVRPAIKHAKPRVFMPVFPGTNCEYDTARKFEDAGALAQTYIVRNQSAAEIEASANGIVNGIRESQILMFAGGFSGGDEPDGSGKFIAAMLRNERVADAVREFLTVRKGLILGICNGFQALIKTGLLPFGRIARAKEGDPTLTFNTVNRHVARIAEIRVSSTLSPWLSACSAGDRFLVPVSHGEGRFMASAADFQRLAANGQIATQYVGEDGAASFDDAANPNGSAFAVEGLTDATGLILGKMGHTERAGTGLLRNVPGNYDMKLFESGVKYFA